MALLREQTRHFWTTILFLLLGPVLIGLTLFRIVQRTGSETRSRCERLLTDAVGRPIEIDRVELLRPNVSRVVNVEFKEASVQSVCAFAPEIYLLQLHDHKMLKSFATSFETYASQNRSYVSLNGGSESEEAESWRFDDYYQDYLVVVIPQLHIKEELLNEVRKSFLFDFRKGFAPSDTHKSQQVVCLTAGKIIFQEEKEFLATVESRTSMVPRQPMHTILETFRTAALLQPKTNETSEARSTANDVVAFSSESPIIENFRALYLDDHVRNYRSLDSLFELSKLTSAKPYYASLASCDHADLKFTLSTNGEAIPGSFVARFAPFFQFLGVQGWLEGSVVATSSRMPNQSFDSSDARFATELKNEVGVSLNLKDLHLCQFDLERITLQLGFNVFSGIVADLAISEGTIQDGVIQCNGRVQMKRGVLPRALVHCLSQKGLLEIAPARAEGLRFINDATPFDALELHFELLQDGFVLDSSYKNKIIAYYSQGDVKYGLYLPSTQAGAVEPYESLVAGLASLESERSIWTPLVKKAFLHLPVVKTAQINEVKRSRR